MDRRQFLKLAAATVAALLLPKAKTVEAETPAEQEQREIFDLIRQTEECHPVGCVCTMSEYSYNLYKQIEAEERGKFDFEALTRQVGAMRWEPLTADEKRAALIEGVLNTGYIDQNEGVPCGAIEAASPTVEDARPLVWLDDEDELLPPFDGQYRVIRTSQLKATAEETDTDPSFDAMVEDIERRMRQAFATWYYMPRLSLDDIFTGYEDVDARP